MRPETISPRYISITPDWLYPRIWVFARRIDAL
jgi:hypothetical protein